MTASLKEKDVIGYDLLRFGLKGEFSGEDTDFVLNLPRSKKLVVNFRL